MPFLLRSPAVCGVWFTGSDGLQISPKAGSPYSRSGMWERLVLLGVKCVFHLSGLRWIFERDARWLCHFAELGAVGLMCAV